MHILSLKKYGYGLRCANICEGTEPAAWKAREEWTWLQGQCQASSFEFSTLVAHQNHQVEEKVKVVLKRVLLSGWSMGPGVGSSGQAVACGLEESVALEVSEKLESVGMKELEEWEAVAELGMDVGTGGQALVMNE